MCHIIVHSLRLYTAILNKVVISQQTTLEPKLTKGTLGTDIMSDNAPAKVLATHYDEPALYILQNILFKFLFDLPTIPQSAPTKG